jgi:hypothetical protein
MRTKTLLLTSALTALSSAALMAQTNVYSLNAVGYINVTCVPGFNMIACQLITTNNTVNGLMPDTLNAAQTAGYIDNVTIYKYTGSGFSIASANSVTAAGYPTNNWASGGNLTLNPGEAVWLKNPFTTNLVFTFVGTVPQGLLTNQITGPSSFTMLSSQVPQSGDLATNLGMTNFQNGDQIFVFNPTTQQYATYNVSFTTGNSGYQIGGFGVFTGNTGDPQLNVGQGFWYHTGSTAGGSGATTWIRNFSVNP